MSYYIIIIYLFNIINKMDNAPRNDKDRVEIRDNRKNSKEDRYENKTTVNDKFRDNRDKDNIDTKTDRKNETKTDRKTETKTDRKTETKIEEKTSIKTETKIEEKTSIKTETKIEINNRQEIIPENNKGLNKFNEELYLDFKLYLKSIYPLTNEYLLQEKIDNDFKLYQMINEFQYNEKNSFDNSNDVIIKNYFLCKQIEDFNQNYFLEKNQHITDEFRYFSLYCI